jgi:phosphoribosylformylglycinamidine synthase
MTAYEMLLSESQERMLIVAHSGREREVVDIFKKWDLDAVVIGRVRDTGRMQVVHNGEMVADIPVAALTDEAPRYERPMVQPGKEGVHKEHKEEHKQTVGVPAVRSHGADEHGDPAGC